MEVLFSTKDFQEFKEKENILKNSEFEFSTKVNNSKYELSVDKNIYEEAKILLDLSNDNTENSSNPDNENQKKDFLYYVNQFFNIKYCCLVIVSIFLSFIITAIFLIKIIRLKGFAQFIEIPELYQYILLPFLLTFIISQAIFLSTRYYIVLKDFGEIFTLRIGKRINYNSSLFKVINFLLAIIGNIIYCAIVLLILLK